jgi:hypothetical protein
MAAWVLTRDDLITYGGLPSSALVADAREIVTVYVAQSTFEIPGHGCSGAQVRLTARPGSTLPTGINPLTWYTAATTTDPDFLSLVGVTLSDAGSGTLFLIEDVTPKIAKILGAVTSYLVASAKAYAGPWTAGLEPQWAHRVGAHIAAPDVADLLRLPKARFDIDAARERAKAAETFVGLLRKGEEMDDNPVQFDATPALSEAGAQVVLLQGRDFHRHEGDPNSDLNVA